MFWIVAKKLNDQEMVQAVLSLKAGTPSSKNKAFLDMRDTFNGLIYKALSRVSKAYSDPQEKRDTQAFIEAEFFGILREIKKSSNPAMIKSYIQRLMGNRINVTRVRDFLGKSSVMKDIRSIEIELGKGLKKYFEKKKDLPNFKNQKEIKELAFIMRKPVDKVEEMISIYGPDKIKSIYSPAETKKVDNNVSILLDSISNQKPLPDKIYRDKELLKIFIKEMERVLTPDERLVIKNVYRPDDPRAPKKKLEDIAADMAKENPQWSFRKVKHELSKAQRKIKNLPLAEEIKYSMMKEQFVKYALINYDYDVKISFIDGESIVSKFIT